MSLRPLKVESTGCFGGRVIDYSLRGTALRRWAPVKFGFMCMRGVSEVLVEKMSCAVVVEREDEVVC